MRLLCGQKVSANSIDKPTSVHFTSRQCHPLDAIVSEPSRPILCFAGSLESIGWARCGACVKRTGARIKPTGTDQRFVATVGLEPTTVSRRRAYIVGCRVDSFPRAANWLFQLAAYPKMAFNSRNSCNPASPHSRPLPDCL